ncbi:MAG TPA: hypothetical protein VFH88_08320 [Candidatus Krumholzibacteria bacterium]|nr:hypothetical protein [Candidatus Krumholzibacteria bacterium]
MEPAKAQEDAATRHARRVMRASAERGELKVGITLIQNKALVPVIDMLIETSFKLGEYEDW